MSHQDGLGNNGAEASGLTKPDDGDDRMQKRVKMSRMAGMVSNLTSSRIQGTCGIRLRHVAPGCFHPIRQATAGKTLQTLDSQLEAATYSGTDFPAAVAGVPAG